MTQAEFNRIVIHGTFEDLHKAALEYPKLLERCALLIEMELRDRLPPIDENDYQRLVDRGLEEIETYDFIDDV